MCVYAWQHKIFHMQNAKVRCGNNKTNHGISTRQDVEFRRCDISMRCNFGFT